MPQMTIDQATKLINNAKKGSAREVARRVASQLSKDDRILVGSDLEEMAIVLDYS